jgi:hypothetical protein
VPTARAWDERGWSGNAGTGPGDLNNDDGLLASDLALIKEKHEGLTRGLPIGPHPTLALRAALAAPWAMRMGRGAR